MDSTAVKSLTEVFTKLFDNGTKVGGPDGNPIGVAIGAVLLISLLLAGALYFSVRYIVKERSRVDAERREERIQDKREAAEAVTKAELKSDQQRERDERIAAAQRERDDSANRERARTDQSDREQARGKLMEHVDFVVDKLNTSYTSVFNRIDAALGALQGTTQNHDGRLVSLEKENARMHEELKEIRAELKTKK
jgi:hypothetical protein